MPLYVVYWNNKKTRSGMSGILADSEQQAREQCIEKIESKYYWQGKCEIESCKLAAKQPGDKR